ncbi:DUF6056 family protein [Enterococcus mundtii]|uniref:DUF6056 family protein n=1 Tax=Enterococcus mundtii TaxID=53346 RepID=UPI0035C683D6
MINLLINIYPKLSTKWILWETGARNIYGVASSLLLVSSMYHLHIQMAENYHLINLQIIFMTVLGISCWCNENTSGGAISCCFRVYLF